MIAIFGTREYEYTSAMRLDRSRFSISPNRGNATVPLSSWESLRDIGKPMPSLATTVSLLAGQFAKLLAGLMPGESFMMRSRQHEQPATKCWR